MKRTQYQKILDYMDKHGSITPMDAFVDLRITKLATRISEMVRAGMEFTKTLESRKNRDGETVRYMRYSRA